MRLSNSLLAAIITTGILLTLAGLLFAQSNTFPAHPFIVSYVIKNSDSTAILEEFSQYLSQHSGYPLTVEFASNDTDLSQKIRNDPFTISSSCGAPYTQNQKTEPQQRVALPIFKQKPTCYSPVLAGSNASEKALVEFKDGVLAILSGALIADFYPQNTHSINRVKNIAAVNFDDFVKKNSFL